MTPIALPDREGNWQLAEFKALLLAFLGGEVVCVVYSDEWGIGGDLEKEPITVVTAVLLNMDSQWTPLGLDLSEAVGKIPRQLLFKRTELKGAILFKEIRKKRRLAAEATKALIDVLSLVPKHRLQIFHGAIDRRGYSNFKEEFGHHPNVTSDQRDA